MTHERWRVDLAGYVLGGLTARERADLEAHLDGCDACRAELDDLRGIPALLDRVASPDAPPAPPPGLRDRVLAQVPAQPASVAAPVAAQGGRRWLAAVAAALVVGVVAGAGVMRALAPIAEPVPVVVRLAAVEDRGGGEARLRESAAGVELELALEDLPPLPEGETYVVWLSDGERRTTAGSFEGTGEPVTLTLAAAGDLDGYRAMGVSVIAGDPTDPTDVVTGRLPG